jgi:hypothetical protein
MTDIDDILEEVKTIKQDIEDAKQEKAKAEGVLSEHMRTLKSFGIKSIVDGNKKLKVFQKEIKVLESSIQEKFTQLEENYEW